MPPLYRIQVEDRQLRVLLDSAKLDLSPGQLNVVGQALKTAAENVRERAVHNVSGYPVMYDGRSFRINTRTGTASIAGVMSPALDDPSSTATQGSAILQ